MEHVKKFITCFQLSNYIINIISKEQNILKIIIHYKTKTRTYTYHQNISSPMLAVLKYKTQLGFSIFELKCMSHIKSNYHSKYDIEYIVDFSIYI